MNYVRGRAEERGLIGRRTSVAVSVKSKSKRKVVSYLAGSKRVQRARVEQVDDRLLVAIK